MRLLDRYLLRELLVALVVCFCAFILLWITTSLLTELHRFQDFHLSAGEIAEYYLFELPDFIPIALPLALLLALLYALTNHARYNEITAMRAAGISLARICVPYFIVGFVASVVLFAIDEFYAPKAAQAAEQIETRRVEQRISPAERHEIKNLHFINSSIGGQGRAWSAAIYNTKTFEMTEPRVFWTPTNGGPRVWLSASTAVWSNRMWNFCGDVEEKMESNGQLVRVLKTTNTLAMPEFSEKPKQIQGEISINTYRGLNSKTHRADIPLADILNYLRLHPHPDRKTRSWLFTKLHGRFAGPFTCLVVVFVAVPFAAGSGRRNVFVGVAASIVIFFTYFVLQQVGLTFGETGWVWPWFGAWFPNLFFTVTGLIMMARVR